MPIPKGLLCMSKVSYSVIQTIFIKHLSYIILNKQRSSLQRIYILAEIKLL